MNPKITATDGPPVADATNYRSLAGALQYLTFTRPDIAYVVQQVCLHMHDPREPHLAALKHLSALGPELKCNLLRSQEDTSGGTRGEFVGSYGRQVGITDATKDTKMIIGRRSAKEGKVRSR
jgi:hypothetical protein